MKPEFSSSDLMLALAIVNGTTAVARKAGAAEPREANAPKADREEADRPAAGNGTTGRHR